MNPRDYDVISKYYDGAYNVKADLVDLPFYLQLGERFGGPVLEVACGTGRVLLELARRGLDVWGVDYAPGQLAVLQEKLAREPEDVRRRVNLCHGDMRDFSLGRTFPLVLMPFRALQHMYTVDEQVAALTAVKRHLAPGGVFAFDVFYPLHEYLFAPHEDETQDSEWAEDGLTIRRFYRWRRVDKLRQYFDAEFIFRVYRGEELVKEERAPLKMCWYTYPHLQLLFKHCGLSIVEEYGGFTGEPVDVCKQMVFVLKA